MSGVIDRLSSSFECRRQQIVKNKHSTFNESHAICSTYSSSSSNLVKKALKRDTIASSPSPGGHLTIEASVSVPLAAQAQAESEALLCPSRPNRTKARRPKKAEREGKQ